MSCKPTSSILLEKNARRRKKDADNNRATPNDDATVAARTPKPRRKAVPDSRNALKYLLATSSNPTLPFPSHDLPPSPRSISFHFAVVADVQYARLPTARGVKAVLRDGRTVPVRRRRAWKEAAGKLEEAILAFDKARVDFAVNLGDAIEGYATKEERRSRKDLAKICDVFDNAKGKVYHVIGNHCRRVPLPLLQKSLRLKETYYSFSPADGWRCVVLNSADLCGGTADATEEEGELLNSIVEREGRAMHHFHGALGDGQLWWLGMQLDQAEEEGERVVLFSHHPLADDSARPSHVLANTKQVREIVERRGTPVVLCLAGHDHMGGVLTVPANEQRRAVTYVTVPAILEAPKGGNAYGFVTAYSDGCLTIEGVGDMFSYVVLDSSAVQAADAEA